VFIRVDNIAQAARVGLAWSHREPQQPAKLLADRLVVIDPSVGIEVASLSAPWVEAPTERQTVGPHGGDGGGEVDVSQLVNTLGGRLGQSNVFRAGHHVRRGDSYFPLWRGHKSAIFSIRPPR
jgi:hypothetical protein